MSAMMSTSSPWRRSYEADAPACSRMSSDLHQSFGMSGDLRQPELHFNTSAPAFIPRWNQPMTASAPAMTSASTGFDFLAKKKPVCAVDLDDFTDDDDSDASDNENDDGFYDAVEHANFYDALEHESDMTPKQLLAEQKSVGAESPRSDCATVSEPDSEPTPTSKLESEGDVVFSKLNLLSWRASYAHSTHDVAPVSIRAAVLKQPPTPEVCPWEQRLQAQAASPAGARRSHQEQVPSETSWAAQQRSRRLAVSGQSDADVARAIKSILNKLSMEKFGELSKQLFNCGITTVNHVTILINEVFEKATLQHNFIDMYADLCVELNDFFSTKFEECTDNVKFRRLLLDKCQSSFMEKFKPPAGLESMEPDERSLAETKYKSVMLGNIRLVGALLRRGMLASKIFVAILQELLADPNAESLEAAAALLTVAGPAFDTATWTHYDALLSVFGRVQELIVTPKACSPRARFLLKDVMELRERGWEDNRPKRVEQPTTLAEQAYKAAQETTFRDTGSCRKGCSW